MWMEHVRIIDNRSLINNENNKIPSILNVAEHMKLVVGTHNNDE